MHRLTSALRRIPCGRQRSSATARAPAAVPGRRLSTRLPRWRTLPPALCASRRAGSTRSSSGPESLPRYHRLAIGAQVEVFRICRRTRARVGGRHQLESRRVARDAVTTGEPNLALLQRSSQCFHRADPDLRTLVEEQHAPVRTADRARPGQPRPAADQRGNTRRVVWRHKRRPRDQRRAAGQRPPPSGSPSPRAIQLPTTAAFRKALRQHRFADAGRPGHHQVMGAGRGNSTANRACDWPTTSARSTAGSGAATERRSGRRVERLRSTTCAIALMCARPHTSHTLDQARLCEVVDRDHHRRHLALSGQHGRQGDRIVQLVTSGTVFSSRSHAFLPLADNTADASAR